MRFIASLHPFKSHFPHPEYPLDLKLGSLNQSDYHCVQTNMFWLLSCAFFLNHLQPTKCEQIIVELPQQKCCVDQQIIVP